jgi:hypothetical protein
MALTAFRAIRLRMAGLRVSIVESLLQDGIYYFGKRRSQEVHFIASKPFVAAMVFGLNASMVTVFAATPCTYQLILQRMTQVLTVVMVSHMFLNLKGSNSRAFEGAVSTNVVFGSMVDREKSTRDLSHSIFGSVGQSRVEVDSDE